jgi:anti-sigma-K factor RskA
VSNEHPVDDLAAYALGSLEETERPRVETHVDRCAACAATLQSYQGVIDTLPLALAPAPPPLGAWETIQTAVRERRVRRERPARAASLRAWLRVARWPAVAATIVVLVIWNVTLQREIVRRSPGPAPGPEVEALSRRPGHIVILTGSGQPGANARIFVAVDGGGHLAVSGLPSIPRERTYQLWFLRAGEPGFSGATFRVDSQGRAWAKVAVPASLDEVDAIAITEEPSPGSSTPTGQHLLDSRPWR